MGDATLLWPLPDYLHEQLTAIARFKDTCKNYNVKDSADHLIQIAKDLHASGGADAINTLKEMGELIAEGKIGSQELMRTPIELWRRYIELQLRVSTVVIYGDIMPISGTGTFRNLSSY